MSAANGCPTAEAEDGRKRKEQLCIDSSHDVWMGLDPLTVFPAPCYGTRSMVSFCLGDMLLEQELSSLNCPHRSLGTRIPPPPALGSCGSGSWADFNRCAWRRLCPATAGIAQEEPGEACQVTPKSQSIAV